MRNRNNDTVRDGISSEITAHALGSAQAFLYQSYTRVFSGSGIRPSQFCALIIIAANPGLMQCALAQALGISHPRAVGFVDELEERGLVTRGCLDSDRRKYAITITPLGSITCDQLKDRVRQHECQVTRDLTPDEVRTMVSLLRRMTGH